MDAIGSAGAGRPPREEPPAADHEYGISDEDDDDDDDDDDSDNYDYDPMGQDAVDEALSRSRRDVSGGTGPSRSVRSCWPPLPSPSQQYWARAPIWAPLFRVTAVQHPPPQPPPPPAGLQPLQPQALQPQVPQPLQPQAPQPLQPQAPQPLQPQPLQPLQPQAPQPLQPQALQPLQPRPQAPQPRPASRPVRRPPGPAQVPRPVPVVRQPAAGGNPVYGNRMKLFCRTGFHLTIGPKGRVSGTSNRNDKYAVLEFSSVSNGEVRIRGVEANLFLAMNREGKLYGQANVRQEGTVFVEMLLGQYNTYLSRKFAHAGWYVGIKKNGKQKPGHKTAWGQKAIQFLPMRVT